jgi:Helix-turn-helix domain
MTIPQPNPYVTLDPPTEVEVARTERKRARQRRPLPPPAVRDWMTANETALALGCSVATVHRLRRGLIPGVEPLPCSQYGRKCVFRKASITLWQENNEKRGPQ